MNGPYSLCGLGRDDEFVNTAYGLSGINGDEESEASTIEKIEIISKAVDAVAAFLRNLGITNDNGVIAARDKIAEYVTQVMGNRELAYQTLYTGYSLAHADINNVGTKSYYEGVLKRLFEAASNYILNHTPYPKFTLDRFVAFVQQGNNIDHAFWLALTGKKDPHQITANSVIAPTGSGAGIPSAMDPMQAGIGGGVIWAGLGIGLLAMLASGKG